MNLSIDVRGGCCSGGDETWGRTSGANQGWAGHETSGPGITDSAEDPCILSIDDHSTHILVRVISCVSIIAVETPMRKIPVPLRHRDRSGTKKKLPFSPLMTMLVGAGVERFRSRGSADVFLLSTQRCHPRKPPCFGPPPGTKSSGHQLPQHHQFLFFPWKLYVPTR